MENYSLNVGSAIGTGWEYAKKHGLVVAVILLGIWLITSMVGSLTGTSMDIETARELGEQIGRGNWEVLKVYRDQTTPTMGVSIMGLLLDTVVYVGLYNLALGLMSGRLTEAGFDVFKLPLMVYVKFFVTELLVSIIATISILLCVIPAFFIIPRIIFAPIYLIDNPDAGIIESIQASWKMTKGETIDIIVIGLAILGITILGYLCCCVGIFFADAVSMFIFTAAYYQMRGKLV